MIKCARRHATGNRHAIRPWPAEILRHERAGTAGAAIAHFFAMAEGWEEVLMPEAIPLRAFFDFCSLKFISLSDRAASARQMLAHQRSRNLVVAMFEPVQNFQVLPTSDGHAVGTMLPIVVG